MANVTLNDWLATLGATPWDPGISYRVDIDSFTYALVSQWCVAPRGRGEEGWPAAPERLDGEGIVTVWRADSVIVTMTGKLAELLPILGAATQVPFLYGDPEGSCSTPQR